MNVCSYKNQQGGFSLLEVLIAIFVIAFGFMALLKLQLTTLDNMTGANQRFIAASLANSVADMMRVNSNKRNDYHNADTQAFNKDCGVATCQLFEQDLALWKRSLESRTQSLPNAQGVINVNSINNIVTVTISWDEKRSREAATNESYALEVLIL